MSDPKRPFRVLSLDGGGIRGLVTAIWLQRLEELLGAPLHKHFDLIAGCSTGSIAACAVSAGIGMDRVVELYRRRGREVFPAGLSRHWSRVSRLFSDGLSAPRYDGEGLEKSLQDAFGPKLFGELVVKPTLVVAYDAFGREAMVFKNTREKYFSLPVWELCRASCAAPGYFPAHPMQVGGVEVPLIDGGVVANNPTACAIAEAVRVHGGKKGMDPRELVVASFGAGGSVRRITTEQAREWGATEWAVPLIDVLFDGSADAVDYIARQLVGCQNYFRFQIELKDAYDDLDNADETNLNALVRIANQHLESHETVTRMEALAERLDGA